MGRSRMSLISGCIAVTIAFNAAALNTVLNTGTRAVALDPFLNSVCHMLFFLVAVILSAANFVGLFCVYGASVASLLFYYGVYQPAHQFSTLGDPHGAFTSTAYPATIALQLLVGVSYVFAVYRCFTENWSIAVRSLQVILGLSFVCGTVVAVLFGLPGGKCNDHADFDVDNLTPVFRPANLSSRYLTMRDGVRLATDVYLPSGWKAGEASSHLPALVVLTRYNRNRVLRWPWTYVGMRGDIPRPSFSLIMNKYVGHFVPRGYACVCVDVRGTGASFGHRDLDLSQAEVDDFGEVLKWVKQQPWSNGRVGSAGVSYDGIAAGMMASQGGVSAAAFLFSPLNFVQDILSPGGVLNTGFLTVYSVLTHRGERNRFPTRNECPQSLGSTIFFKFVLGGVFPVGADQNALDHALVDHGRNWDMQSTAARFKGFAGSIIVPDNGKDRLVEDVGFTNDVMRKLADNNVALAVWAGYWDHASVTSALRLHREMGGEKVRLTFGPWAHGGVSCFTPHSPGYKRSYPILEDVFDFFQCHLNDNCAAMVQRKEPFHYFQIGQEKWHASSSFPPIGASWQTYYLSATSGLVDDGSRDHTGIIQHTVSNATSTGYASRWNVISHVLGFSPHYPDRLDEDDLMLTFNTEPLASDLHMAGTALVNVTLDLASGESAVVFAYLEDVDPLSARIHYVTEGLLRVGHAVVGRSSVVGAWDSVERSYRPQDFHAPSGNELVELALQPVAYTFAAGHLIRLSFAGADVDNFNLTFFENVATVWKVRLDEASLKLPVQKY